MVKLIHKKIGNSQLGTLWKHIAKRRKKQFLVLLILMFFASVAEVISIGSVLPFLAVLAAPDQVYQHQLMQPINNLLNITHYDQLLLPLTMIFILAVLLAGIVRLVLLYIMTRLTFITGADLSIDIYRRTLYQEYSVYLTRNSSEIINGIINKTNTVISSIISPFLYLISSIIIVVAILSALFLVDFIATLSLFLVFGALYLGVINYTKRQLKDNGEIIASHSTQMIKSLQEGLGGVRDVLIDNNQEFYCNLYRNADMPLRIASSSNMFISASPRFAMEALGIIVITGVAYIMSLREEGLNAVIPVLGVLAMGAQRLLPALQQIYGAYSQIKGSRASFQDVLDLLNQPLPKYALPIANNKPFSPMIFANEIELVDLSFKYVAGNENRSPWIIKNLNLKIPRGACVGFIGETGCGKSSLLDIIMGLLSPAKGKILIDGQIVTNENKREWQANISHVPQNIFLTDGTVEENIAFGVDKNKIDHKRVEKSAKQAQLSELIDSWPNGYNTFVGERGVRISGGQRQRIGIARALYKKSNILIFDEATSALDTKTEKNVMSAIKELKDDYTILIIAHRTSTLKTCDTIVKLDKGKIASQGTYNKMIATK
jgi:ATP-binding cassette, subfamily B, bacterial PglK